MSGCPRCRSIMLTLSPLGFEHNHDGPMGLSDMMMTFGAPMNRHVKPKDMCQHVKEAGEYLRLHRINITADYTDSGVVVECEACQIEVYCKYGPENLSEVEAPR